ncbi:hypothetical protein EON80_00060 [bacterium]|nr:MAG: hypothetical protein EON80_00060 [bacterium]
MMVNLEGPGFARKKDAPKKFDEGRFSFIHLLVIAMRQGADRILVRGEEMSPPSQWEVELLSGDLVLAEMKAEYMAHPDYDDTMVRGLFYLLEQKIDECYFGGAKFLFTELEKHVGVPFSVDLNMLVDEMQVDMYPTNKLGEQLWARYRSMSQKSFDVLVSVEPETKTATITLKTG